MKNNQNYPKFLLLWIGEFISSIGGGLTSFGLGVYIFEQTESAASMAIVTLLAFLPTILLGVPAGVLADRHDRRALMMIGDGFSALGIVYILFCMIKGRATLLNICIGVSVSAVFSSLLEPSYKATITDILSEEEYSKAGGLVSLAGSARYLFSPVIAGLLLAVSDVKLLLIIDICTFFLTVVCTAVVRAGIGSKEVSRDEGILKSIKEGAHIVGQKKGVVILVFVSAVITLFMGVFQILAEPMILSFADAKTLGIAETVCASGMLAGGLYLGIKGIKGHYRIVLGMSLTLSGLFMLGFGLFENMIPVVIFGFLFFLMLPFANNGLDLLIRTNIPDDAQGRAWGLIGTISQLGYVFAYAISGSLADAVGMTNDKGVGRGSATVIMIAGMCLFLISPLIMILKSIKELENRQQIIRKE